METSSKPTTSYLTIPRSSKKSAFAGRGMTVIRGLGDIWDSVFDPGAHAAAFLKRIEDDKQVIEQGDVGLS